MQVRANQTVLVLWFAVLVLILVLVLVLALTVLLPSQARTVQDIKITSIESY